MELGARSEVCSAGPGSGDRDGSLKRTNSVLLAVLLFAVALANPLTASSTSAADLRSGQFLFQAGDSMDWAVRTFDDSAWSFDQPVTDDHWWCRIHVETVEFGLEESLHLRARMLGAWELYLDGRLIGRNGTVGTSKESEIPGAYTRAIPLDPLAWTKGHHVLAFRVSSFHAARISRYHGVAFVDLEADYLDEFPTTVLFMSLAGLLVFGSVFFLLLYGFAERRPAHLLLGLLCSAVATLLVLEFSKFFYHYPYYLHRTRLILISFDTMIIGILLPAFLLNYASIPGKRQILGFQALILATMLLVIGNFDRQCLFMQRETIGVSMAIVVWGLWKRRSGLVPVLLGLSACFAPMLFTGMRFADRWLFLGFVILVLLLVVQATRTVAERYRERQEALARAASLRYELLQKRIQPHFLMNSLATAISWIEENPSSGIQMLRTLARELEAFFRIGERPSIPATEELELCRLHAATMGYMLDRKIEFTVEVSDLGGSATLPPGILLTLVENAITHGSFGSTGGEIHIRQETIEETDGWRQCYEVTNPFSTSNTPCRPGGGQGLTYIRSRLEEAYGQDWALEVASADGIWATQIRFRSTHP